MGYLNPILSYGPERFCADAAARRRRRADHRRPADRGSRPAAAARRRAAGSTSSAWSRRRPTTSGCRTCSNGSSGFVYYVSITGITGTRSATAEDLAAAIPRIRRVNRPAGRGRLRRAHARAGGRGGAASPMRAVVASALIDTLAASLDARGPRRTGHGAARARPGARRWPTASAARAERRTRHR